MSRIAKYPVELPKGVEASIQPGLITVKGPLGTLSQVLNGDVVVSQEAGKLSFVVANETRQAKASIQGNQVKMQLGFSHDILHTMPEGVKAECPTQTEIVLKGSNKQVVGQTAAELRAYRPPEPYKGKGVRYIDERVTIKETKKK